MCRAVHITNIEKFFNRSLLVGGTKLKIDYSGCYAPIIYIAMRRLRYAYAPIIYMAMRCLHLVNFIS